MNIRLFSDCPCHVKVYFDYLWSLLFSLEPLQIIILALLFVLDYKMVHNVLTVEHDLITTSMETLKISWVSYFAYLFLKLVVYGRRVYLNTTESKVLRFPFLSRRHGFLKDVLSSYFSTILYAGLGSLSLNASEWGFSIYEFNSTYKVILVFTFIYLVLSQPVQKTKVEKLPLIITTMVVLYSEWRSNLYCLDGECTKFAFNKGTLCIYSFVFFFLIAVNMENIFAYSQTALGLLAVSAFSETSDKFNLDYLSVALAFLAMAMLLTSDPGQVIFFIKVFVNMFFRMEFCCVYDKKIKVSQFVAMESAQEGLFGLEVSGVTTSEFDDGILKGSSVNGSWLVEYKGERFYMPEAKYSKFMVCYKNKINFSKGYKKVFNLKICHCVSLSEVLRDWNDFEIYRPFQGGFVLGAWEMNIKPKMTKNKVFYLHQKEYLGSIYLDMEKILENKPLILKAFLGNSKYKRYISDVRQIENLGFRVASVECLKKKTEALKLAEEKSLDLKLVVSKNVGLFNVETNETLKMDRIIRIRVETMGFYDESFEDTEEEKQEGESRSESSITESEDESKEKGLDLGDTLTVVTVNTVFKPTVEVEDSIVRGEKLQLNLPELEQASSIALKTVRVKRYKKTPPPNVPKGKRIFLRAKFRKSWEKDKELVVNPGLTMEMRIKRSKRDKLEFSPEQIVQERTPLKKRKIIAKVKRAVKIGTDTSYNDLSIILSNNLDRIRVLEGTSLWTHYLRMYFLILLQKKLTEFKLAREKGKKNRSGHKLTIENAVIDKNTAFINEGTNEFLSEFDGRLGLKLLKCNPAVVDFRANAIRSGKEGLMKVDVSKLTEEACRKVLKKPPNGEQSSSEINKKKIGKRKDEYLKEMNGGWSLVKKKNIKTKSGEKMLRMMKGLSSKNRHLPEFTMDTQNRNDIFAAMVSVKSQYPIFKVELSNGKKLDRSKNKIKLIPKSIWCKLNKLRNTSIENIGRSKTGNKEEEKNETEIKERISKLCNELKVAEIYLGQIINISVIEAAVEVVKSKM